jgi:hypothetical protein
MEGQKNLFNSRLYTKTSLKKFFEEMEANCRHKMCNFKTQHMDWPLDR